MSLPRTRFFFRNRVGAVFVVTTTTKKHNICEYIFVDLIRYCCPYIEHGESDFEVGTQTQGPDEHTHMHDRPKKMLEKMAYERKIDEKILA